MKIFTYLFAVIIIITFNLFAHGTESYLITVPIDNDFINNKIERLELPVIYFDSSQLITSVNSEKLNTIRRFGIKHSIIDQLASSDKLFLVSSKVEKNITSKLITENIVYYGSDFNIVKNISLKSDDAAKIGLEVLELNAENKFKNEKRIWKRDGLNITDSLITNITSSVNSDSVQFFIQSLQNFQTRFLLADTRNAVANWIKNQFLQMGFTDVVIDSFQYQGTWQKNVIATLSGIYEPQVYNIVGGHHDSYSSGNPMDFAPGADDNASGTAAVLEIARVIKENNYQPESTIKFITFAAEEYGLWGSKDYAQKALDSGMNIKIMINHDMISHTYYPSIQSEVDINRYSGYDYIRDLAFSCIENYSVLTPSNGSLNSAGSDSYSFWERGFPSVYFEETNFSPFYHSPADTIGNYNMEYCAEVIKASCATLLLNILMPTMIQNYNLLDAGTGNSLLMNYSPNLSPDFSYYKIYFGNQSGVYDSIFTSTDTMFTITGLTEGNLYYAGVTVVDQEGYESLIVERSATPQSIPQTPKGFKISPQWLQVELSWNHNSELDIIGYNIYRSEIEGEPGSLINSSAYSDTNYVDITAASGVYYYYSITAVDSQLNESESTIALRSRIVSLDQGILIVDETFDGNGSLMNPTDEQVDEFYGDILTNFKIENYDLIEQGSISLDDLGAYSTIIWHGNDIQDFSAPFDFKESIKSYLEFGGNFLYTGYRPGKAFENASGNPAVFGSGDFIYDYLKIDSVYFRITTLFNEALTQSIGYNSLYVDSSKTSPVESYHLRFIEAILSNLEGENIYSFETNFDSISSQGSLKGKPVGVEYIGNDFKTVTLSFPLYYINKEQAKSLIEYILTNKFDEIMPVDEYTNELPVSYQLEQNYPNPFNPSTKIVYSIPESGFVKLSVYNMLGEEVARLVNTTQNMGRYEVNFNASNLSSGVYVYRLEVANYTSSKKLMLMK